MLHTVQDPQDLRAVTLVHIYWDHGVQYLPISLGAIWCKSFNLQPPSPLGSMETGKVQTRDL